MLFNAMCFRVASCAAVFTVVCSIPVFGQTDEKSESEGQTAKESMTTTSTDDIQNTDLWTRDRLMGDWGGLSTDLKESGITLSLSCQQVMQVNTYGGIETKNGHDIGGSYILGFELDLKKIFELKGSSFFMETKGTYGGEASDFDGEKVGGLLATRTDSNDVGFYLGFDQVCWKESSDPNDKQGISLFARYGAAHGDVNRIEEFWSFGGQYVGMIEGRDKDTLGIGVAQAIQSNQYHNEVSPRADRETVCELYYANQLSPWCVLTPDLQFITNSGGDKDDRNALVAGLRVRIWF